MDAPLCFLGIPGSLRRASYNRAALVAAQSLLPDGVRMDIFDLAGISLYNQDSEEDPAPRLMEFKKQIRAADAIVLATPEYNYSVPGVLKNAIDCASRPYGDSAWTGKPVAVMGASIGLFGSARAQYHLRQTFITLDMLPVNQPEVMIANACKVFDTEGVLVDVPTRELIRQLMENLADLTRKLGSEI